MKAVLKEIYLTLRQAFLRGLGLLLRARMFSPDGYRPRKVLLIRVDRLGDMTLTTPAFGAIKNRFPEAELTVLAAPAAGALISADPRVAGVVLWTGGPLRKARTIRELRRARFDMVIDPLNSYTLETAIVAFLSGAGVSLGYDSYGRGIFFDLRSAPPGRVHFAEEALYLLRLAGISGAPLKPQLYVSKDAAAAADGILAGAGVTGEDLIISIHPGGVYSSKRWAADRFAEVASRLVRGYGAKLVLIANEEERALAETVCSRLPPGANVIKAVDLRPDVLSALMRKSLLFIGNNSGPLHIAAAFGVPGVSTMGPADPVKWPPLGPDQVVLRADLACSPCNKGACKGHECMKNLTVEMMMTAAAGLLARQGFSTKERL